MKNWGLVVAWLANTLVLSLILAVFEIFLEKDKGWASGLNPSTWGRKLLKGSIIARLCEKPYITTYHIFVFLVVMPAIFLGEYLLLKKLGIGHPVSGNLLGASKPFLGMPLGELRFAPSLFLISVWLLLLGAEDFLWFALNWFYPGSLKDLLSGNVWWHSRWVSFGTTKLPRFYLSLPLLSALFLFASVYFSG